MAQAIQAEYEIVLINNILDSVHGMIGLTEVENEIERKPIFKRLQDISQLGLVKRIFPCALHNRYVHSLGVMYVVDKMASKLRLTGDERQIVRLAGLLHDIGHYPFSHDIETVYKSFYTAKPKVKGLPLPTACDKINKITGVQKIDMELSGHMTDKYHHESIGALVIRHNRDIRKAISEHYVENSPMLRNRFTDLGGKEAVVDAVLDDIASIVVGNCQHESKLFPEKYTLFVQMMHSELDADNIDYLLRDAAFSGTTYGVMDMHQLIDTICERTVEFNMPNSDHQTQTERKKQAHHIMGVTPKGIGYVDQFMINRYFAYGQVINNKYVSILGAMLRHVVEWFLENGKDKYPFADIEEMASAQDDSQFLAFTDSAIMALINNSQQLSFAFDPLTQRIVNALRRYQAFSLSGDNSDKTYSAKGNAALYDSLIKESDGVYPDLLRLIEAIEEYNRSGRIDEKRAEELVTESFAFQVEIRPLTKQLPKGEYLSILSSSHQLENETYLYDRLMNGIPVFFPTLQEGSEPELIVERPESILRENYKLKYLKLRHYSVN